MARKPRIDQRAIDRHLKDIAKGYERAARRNPIRVPIQTDATAEGVSMAGRDAVEGNPILARLLMRLDEQAQLNPSHYVDVTRFVEEQQLDGEDPSVLAFELEQRDLVEIARTMGGTPRRTPQRRGPHRGEPTEETAAGPRRQTPLHHGRLPAVAVRHRRGPVAHRPLHVPGDPHLVLRRSDISATDLHQALAYLAEHNLIERIDTTPATVAITPEGVSCALSGGSVQEHTTPARTGTT